MKPYEKLCYDIYDELYSNDDYWTVSYSFFQSDLQRNAEIGDGLFRSMVRCLLKEGLLDSKYQYHKGKILVTNRKGFEFYAKYRRQIEWKKSSKCIGVGDAVLSTPVSQEFVESATTTQREV